MISSIKYNRISGNKVLFVDADMPSAYLAHEILSIRNIEMIYAGNGRDAIKIFLKDPFIGCLITELRLPGIEGFELLRTIRQINSSIPAIVQTAFAHNSIIKLCIEAGFDEIVFKPINLVLFARMVQKYTLPSLVMN